jgi:hypothetical protein
VNLLPEIQFVCWLRAAMLGVQNLALQQLDNYSLLEKVKSMKNYQLVVMT